MAKNLVIVESPAKWKTIEKFLWPDYQVVASMWHIRDLPKKTLWIDIDKDFVPTYEISEEKKKTVDNLKKLAKKSNEVWIATDEDREWEAIWWHLCYALNLDPEKTKRIAFHEITKPAITEAIKNPRTINLDLVDAQQARRLLDRLVWYKISPVLWKKIRKWLSAWRVQSVAVKLIVEKEREIQNFKPEESWKIIIELTFKNPPQMRGTKGEHKEYKFKALLTKIWWKNKIFKNKEEVLKTLATLFDDISKIETIEIPLSQPFPPGEKGVATNSWDLSWIPSSGLISPKGGELRGGQGENWVSSWKLKLTVPWKLEFKLIDSTKKENKRVPFAPFTTSTLQQEASRKLGYWVKQTMMIAQKLYEWVDLWNWERQWLITYMRTDSVNLSAQARTQAENIIKKEYWNNYHKSRVYKTKSAWAQEAHEAIRPTDLSKTPESLKNFLDPKQLKLYTLIWKRTLASQMSDAVVEITTFSFSPLKTPDQIWISKWEIVKFDWFMKLYTESHDEEHDENDEENWVLPNIKVWEVLSGENLTALQNFSRPPARYTEASLVKKLESEWIWRPSTYAPTISTIIDRWYIEKFNKKYLIPTDTAYTVNDFLEQYFKTMMDYKFTSKVEEDFDKIALWEENYVKMLENFWENSLKKDLENASEKAEKIVEKVGKNCPNCGKELIYRFSKSWKFIGCSGYPECNFIDQPEEAKDELEALRKKYEWNPCPEWWTIVVKTWRFGPFLASSEYPKVKRIWKIKSEKDEILDEILQEKWLLVDEETGEEMVVKNSRRWQFLAAKNYPAVKIAKNIPKDVWDELKKRMEK